ncbi:MAG: family 10 glycosylhydrolase [Oscillospiraceae bacterium]|nr:family 10 glycosylhydrolase [Oscillospiraceae bacterium]
MKKFIYAFILLLYSPVFLCGCSKKEPESSVQEKLHLYDYEQTPEHLGINTDTLPEPELAYEPLNFTPQYAMWFTAMDYPEILMTKTEDEFTAEIEKRFDNAAGLGINTVYVQVRAFGDAYYESSLFSQGLYAPAGMDFDPLEIMVTAAHERNLSIHSWINPLRCQSDVQMQAMEDRFTLKKWYEDEEKNGTYLSMVDGRWWLCQEYE